MGKPVAKQGDKIVAVDTHLAPGSPPPAVPMPFNGTISIATHPTICVNGMPAATVSTKAMNPPHPSVDGATNNGEVIMQSTGVFFNDKMVARLGDIANTCQVSGPAPLGKVVCGCNVMAGEVGVAVVVVVTSPAAKQAAQVQKAEAVQAQQEAAAAGAALQAILANLGGAATTQAQATASFPVGVRPP